MITLTVKVKPGSFKNEIILEEDGRLLVKIRERPIDGAANSSLIQFLSKEFNISKSAVSLEKGASSRFKKIILAMDQAAFNTIINRYKK